jgi:hypothetical protein
VVKGNAMELNGYTTNVWLGYVFLEKGQGPASASIDAHSHLLNSEFNCIRVSK